MQMQPVTVLMMTQPSRDGFLGRALHSFKRQTLANKRLLLYTTTEVHAASIRERHQADNIIVRVADSPQAMYANALASMPIDHYLALVDDDDQYHPRRLELQADCIQQTPDVVLPCFLSAGLVHFTDSREIFIFDLDKRHDNLQFRMFFSTAMASFARLPASRAFTYKSGSPTDALGRLILRHNKNAVRPTGDYSLLLKVVHGDNHQPYEQHRKHCIDAHRCKKAMWMLEHMADIKTFLTYYYFDPPAPQAVCSLDGLAFAADTTRTDALSFPPLEPPAIEFVNETLEDPTRG